MDDWDISDDMMEALRGERITVTLSVAELVPGTYVYLDADDEVLAVGALDDDQHREVPPASDTFPEDDDDAATIIDAPRLFPDDDLDNDLGSRTSLGLFMVSRAPAPKLTEIVDDDDDPDDHTMIGPMIAPRAPASRRK